MSKTRKIRFIEPGGRVGRPYNAWLTRWPLLGPITLATILHERGHDAAVYNENISGPLLENPAAYADVCSADVVGISIMTPTAATGYDLADRIRQDAPGATIVFGGVHATFLPHEALAHGHIVVRGEGENVIEQIARGEITEGILQPPPPEDLDQIPTLRHDLMRDFDKLLASCRGKEMYQLPLASSRGCPHGCTYCAVTRMFGGRIRRQSVEKVHQDVRRYAEQGFRRLFFYDDNFISDRAWSREMLERIAPLKMKYHAQARADLHWADRSRKQLDRPLLRAMHKAGGDILFVGYETIDEATAKHWHKGYASDKSLRQQLLEDTKILHDHGFWIHGMFVLGPQHGPETADQIVRFARQGHIESIQMSVLTPMPGTPVYEEFKPHLVFRDYPRDWDYYDGAHCLYDHGRLGVERVQQVLYDAHVRFYRWGGISLRRIRSMLEDPMSVSDKLATIWAHLKIARTTLGLWREETRLFLEAYRARLSAGRAQGQPAC